MKTAKKIFKIIGIIAGVVVAVLIVYIIYLYASYHRIEDNLSLEVESHAQANAYLLESLYQLGLRDAERLLADKHGMKI